MAQRRQRGWLKREARSQGDTWMLFFRTTRRFDGKRVENKVPIALVKDLPDKSSVWAEVERLHLPINQVDLRRGVTFADLAQHYAEHELADHTESIHPRRTPQCEHTNECSATACSRDGVTGLRSALNRSKWSNG